MALSCDDCAALRNAGMFSIERSFHKQGDCMQTLGEKQITQAVKEFTLRSLPFENGEIERIDEFRGVAKRIVEEKSNIPLAVWHDFACAPFEVREACTIERKNVLQ